MAGVWKFLGVVGAVIGAAAAAVAIYEFVQNQSTAMNATAEAAQFAEGRWCGVTDPAVIEFDAHGEQMDMIVDRTASGGGIERTTADLSVSENSLLLRLENGTLLQAQQTGTNEISVGSPGQMGELRTRCG